jgi:hypothetical protein
MELYIKIKEKSYSCRKKFPGKRITSTGRTTQLEVRN